MTTKKKTYHTHLLITSMLALTLMFFGLNSKAQDKPTAPEKGYVQPVNAKEKTELPQTQNTKGEKANNEAEVKTILNKVKVPKPRAASPMTGARKRGNDVEYRCGTGDYQGVCKDMWQFTNWDFPNTGTTCGQAAAATIITHWFEKRSDEAFKKSLATYLYKNYGPNNVLGWFGTSWQQVVASITNPYKLSWRKVSGENDLRAELKKGIPVIVIVDSERLRQRGYSYPKATVGIAAHYVVVYGYDSGYYYVSNHPGNGIAKKDFLESWNTWVHGGIDGGNRGYVFWK